jgi:hypothetical protein
MFGFAVGRRRPAHDAAFLWRSTTAAATTKCEADENVETTASSSFPRDRELLQREKARVQAELDRLEGCPSCLVVGVATCVGLAGYLTHLAYELPLPEPPHHGAAATAAAGSAGAAAAAAARKEAIRQALQRRPYFLSMAVGWICVGAYRLYLG